MTFIINVPIEFSIRPDDYKTRVRSRRGFEYVNHIDGWDRLDKNRRRADWYFERVVNDCLSVWDQSEAFRHEKQLHQGRKVCSCMDSLTCRCLERLLLVRILDYLQSRKGNGVRVSYIPLVRAWFVAEYGIWHYDMNNLKIIEAWDSFELEEEYGKATKECV
ncbi:MAG: hypothetical protein V3U54_07665 [Thermodesulfobacteriota bacterium]